MAQRKSVFVVVSKEWINTAVRHLVNRGLESRSTGETHLIIADLEDMSDQRGLWLKDVKTDRLTTDGSEVTMRFMIPWGVIVGLGVVDDAMALKPGFAGDVVFDHADLTDHLPAQNLNHSPLYVWSGWPREEVRTWRRTRTKLSTSVLMHGLHVMSGSRAPRRYL